jgi:signal peptidase I
MNKSSESIWSTVRFFLTSLAIVIPLRLFIAQPFIVSGESMVPTFHNSDYLIVDQISYRLSDPGRGDVIVFRYPYDTKRFFIKRIIGLPGETVIVRGNDVIIKNEANPKGITLDESYISHSVSGDMTVKLDEGEYFVMGDNRPASSDSRVWGVLDEKYITGRALVRLYPFNHISLLPGDNRSEFAHTTSQGDTATTK